MNNTSDNNNNKSYNTTHNERIKKILRRLTKEKKDKIQKLKDKYNNLIENKFNYEVNRRKSVLTKQELKELKKSVINKYNIKLQVQLDKIRELYIYKKNNIKLKRLLKRGRKIIYRYDTCENVKKIRERLCKDYNINKDNINKKNKRVYRRIHKTRKFKPGRKPSNNKKINNNTYNNDIDNIEYDYNNILDSEYIIDNNDHITPKSKLIRKKN